MVGKNPHVLHKSMNKTSYSYILACTCTSIKLNFYKKENFLLH